MCVCLWVGAGAGAGEGSREGIVYLYNLSNSPVLISEGSPSIYLDYLCDQAASFLLFSPLAGLHVNKGCPHVPGPRHPKVLHPCHASLSEHLCVESRERECLSHLLSELGDLKLVIPLLLCYSLPSNAGQHHDGGEDPTNTI